MTRIVVLLVGPCRFSLASERRARAAEIDRGRTFISGFSHRWFQPTLRFLPE
jgi:hypothetical protein